MAKKVKSEHELKAELEHFVLRECCILAGDKVAEYNIEKTSKLIVAHCMAHCKNLYRNNS